MTVLRVDPWDPDFGASVEGEEDPNWLPPQLEFDEPVPWQPIKPEAPSGLPCYAFIDGVRRIDVRLFAEDGDVIAPALAGSYAVGSAWSNRPPSIGDIRVRRLIVTGCGLQCAPVSSTVGTHTLSFEAESSAAATPREILLRLQDRMRSEEAALAASIARRDEADVIVQDGPIDKHSRAPTIGLIKRQAQRYLDPGRQSLLPVLDVGERTPLFRFESKELPRYSWYTRIAERRRIDGSLAGLVRLEVHVDAGLNEARRLADLTASTLPNFAAPLGRDSRSPQNLYPVGQLETVLRNHMGERDVVRRSLELALWRSADA